MEENMDVNYLGEEDEDIYKENILDHFRNPRNFGEIENAEIEHSELNPVCGDMIKVFVKVASDKAEDVKFSGKGCAISMASASMLTDKLKGKSLEEIKNIKKEEILDMLGIKLGIVRIKCGMLCLNTVLKGIELREDKNEQISSWRFTC